MHRSCGRVVLLVLAGGLGATSSGAETKPTHAALEIHPGLFETLAQAVDYPYQVVDFEAAPAKSVMPPKGRWDVGEYGHLSRLKLSLNGPEDIGVTFAAERRPQGRSMPIALVDLRLRGPAEAEWWQKAPVIQGDWAHMATFRERIVLTIRARAEIMCLGRKTSNPRISLIFDEIKDPDVELNVKSYPAWLDRLIEKQFAVWKQVDEHLGQQLAKKLRVPLPDLTIPFSEQHMVYEDVRPKVEKGVLRLEVTVGGKRPE